MGLRMIDDGDDQEEIPQQAEDEIQPEQEVLPPDTTTKSSHRATMRQYSKRVLRDFYHDFRLHGPEAIAKLREESVSNYLRIAVSLIPKEVLLSVSKPAGEMSDRELVAAAEAERQQQLILLEHVQKLRGGSEGDILLEAQRQVLDVIVNDDDDESDEDDAA
jgi:hypothetical protein